MALGLAQPLTNEYQEYFGGGGKSGRCVGLTTMPPTCADGLEIWEPEPLGTLRPLIGLFCVPGTPLDTYVGVGT